MKLIVKNRNQIEKENEVETPHFIVSIFDPGSERPRVKFNEWTMCVSFFEFHDSDKPEIGKVLFDEHMARSIKGQLLELQAEWNIDTIICHCEAGQSRSAGVAAALANFLNGNDMEFFNSSGVYGVKKYTPNMHVYRTMLNVLHEQGESE